VGTIVEPSGFHRGTVLELSTGYPQVIHRGRGGVAKFFPDRVAAQFY
jgi:hypothetical protein